MANFKYLIKDSSFKYFIIGLLMFLVITGGGIYLVKKLLSGQNQQTASQPEQVVVNKQSTTDEGLVITDGTESTKTDDNTDEAEVIAVASPTELSATGPADVAGQLLAVAALFYATSLFIQSKR